MKLDEALKLIASDNKFAKARTFDKLYFVNNKEIIAKPTLYRGNRLKYIRPDKKYFSALKKIYDKNLDSWEIVDGWPMDLPDDKAHRIIYGTRVNDFRRRFS
jgi:hypothetical protein